MWKYAKVGVGDTYRAVNLENSSTTIFPEDSFPVMS